jgi:uncharacterized membrane protein YcaP (DUF421 family)
MSDLGYYLGIHPLGALATVIATVLLYLSFGWILRTRGQRLFASPSSFDLAVVTVLGAIVGRATMGRNPTLSGAVIALGTLLVCERLAGKVRRAISLESRTHRAVAVMVAGQADEDMLAQFHVDDASLWSALRTAGVGAPQDVGLVVLESNGQFSVLRSDAPIHASALIGVRDGDAVHERLVASGLAASGDA